MQDLQGPKIRTGLLETGSVKLIAGKKLTLSTSVFRGNEREVSIDFPDLPKCVHEGSRILLADGQLELLVISVEGDQINTQVILGGILTENKGVNLPGAKIETPGFTEKDEQDLSFGLQLGIEAVAVSFVRTADDILSVRRAIKRLASTNEKPIVIAKLERPEALENLDAILDVSDGVMVARGDLGVEMSPEAVPIAQKRIIEAANNKEKLVITATQMLESMMENPRPTRAEASDVANAIFDGSDAVMLSGETAVGKYPLEAVQMMGSISCQAESHLGKWGRWQKSPLEDRQDDAYFITLAACEMAHDRNVTAIAVFTESGRTALMMSKARPEVPILAFTPSENKYRKMAMFWGVTPYLVPEVETVEAMLQVVESTLITSSSLRPGQQIILICGFPVGAHRAPNLALLHTVEKQKP
jgi:pyruvate kinase